MKRKIVTLILMITTISLSLNAQNTLTLADCYNMAMVVNPLSGEKDSYREISEIKDENLSKNWLPTIDANANLVYNSEVVDVGSSLANLPIPGIADAIKPLPHEQYRVTLDINQVLYDGGSVKSAKALEQADLKINEKQTESDLYKLRSQINNYYFNILLLDRQKDLLNNYLAIISKQLFSLQSALVNGAVIKSDIDVLASGKLKIEQNLAENEIRKTALIKILSGLIGTAIESSTKLVLPSTNNDFTSDISRPELQLFDLRKEQLDAGMKIIDSKRMPKAFGFATLGYGNPPGNNFFKDEFAPYYIVGAGIKWNIFDWNKSKNEKQILTLQKGIIENRKNDMSDNLKRLLDSKNAEIESLNSLLATDNELIAIRQRITAASESQFKNGTITATEYLNELNSEKEALITFEIHKINLAMAGVEYLNISGKNIDKP